MLTDQKNKIASLVVSFFLNKKSFYSFKSGIYVLKIDFQWFDCKTEKIDLVLKQLKNISDYNWNIRSMIAYEYLLC